MFMKQFSAVLFTIIGVPGAILSILFLIGIDLSFLTKIDISGPIGLGVIVLVVIVVGMETAHRIVKDETLKAAEKFYSVNPQARIERAHKIFYDLWQSAQKNGEKWTLEQKRHWDEQARVELVEHCELGMLSNYLHKTRPGEDPLKGISPLPEKTFPAAITELKLLLDGRLLIFIKQT